MRLLKFIIFTFLVLFILSCKRHSAIKKELQILLSKEILIPNYSNKILYKGNNIYDTLTNVELKCVIYVDSTQCNSCFVKHIEQWMKYIYYFRKYDKKLKFYFIFSPKVEERELLVSNMSNSTFDYPIILDFDREFMNLNAHISNNPKLHTFLLDKNNNVIFVGNPLQSKEIEKLFYKKTQELLAK